MRRFSVFVHVPLGKHEQIMELSISMANCKHAVNTTLYIVPEMFLPQLANQMVIALQSLVTASISHRHDVFHGM